MMKPRFATHIAAVSLLVAVAIPLEVCGQNAQSERPKHHHYQLIDLGTLGGPTSYFSNGNDGILNHQGIAAGWADRSTPDPYFPFCFNPDCFESHAFQSQNSVVIDLGVLPGGASSNAGWITANGLLVGTSQNGQIDPLFSGFPEMRAVIWQNSAIQDLGTLPEGGYESVGISANNNGDVVGFALNTIADPFSLAGPGFFPTQTRAFLWKQGAMHDLGTLGGNGAAAFFVNDGGQITGQSYTNTTPNPTTGLPTADSFFWENGKMLDIGSLGGTLGNPTALNSRGQVVGISNMTGDTTSHPYLWSKTKGLQDLGTLGGNNGVANWINNAGDIAGKADLAGPQPQNHDAVLWRKNGAMVIDLGVLPGDACANAYYVNDRGQVVGTSENSELCRIPTGENAFLWESGGPMVDLNSLIAPGSSLELTFAFSINDHGEIVGIGVPLGCTLENIDFCGHAYVLIPCDENHPGIEGCDYSLMDAKAATAVQAATGTRDSKLSAAGQARGPLSSTGLPAAPESTPVRQLLLRQLDFSRFTGSVFPVTSGAPLTSGPSAILSPTSLTFSTQAIGITSAPEIVALTNTGTTTLAISSIAITGTDPADFAQSHTCGSSLAAGASCKVSVTFGPKGSGTRTAILNVADNAAGSPQKASLAGIGTTASLSPANLNFGTRAVGVASPAQTVTLTNVGTTTLTVGSIAITGTDAADFAQTHNCGTPLAAGASCSVIVTFGPRGSGTRTATLSVADNATGSPQKVSLAGIGTTASLSPASLYFASVPIGTTSFAKTVTLTNVGSTVLTVTGIAITGTSARDFEQTHNCASSLAAGASCSISVTFKPTASGIRTAALTLSDNGGGSPQAVSLGGDTITGCIPQGSLCYGPGPNRCCPAPRGHHAFCSNPTGLGSCIQN